MVVTVPPLCIIQARHRSSRLPAKMLRHIGGETLIARGWRIACEAFGAENCVVAIPFLDTVLPLAMELDRIGARIIAWKGDESDVLGRFHHVAHRFRWHPDSIILRYTPDDWRKDVGCLRRVANGERLPVELGGEAFTLAMLDAAHKRESMWGPDKKHVMGLPCRGDFNSRREHITRALFDTAPPPTPPGCWTIDTLEHLDAARDILGYDTMDHPQADGASAE